MRDQSKTNLEISSINVNSISITLTENSTFLGLHEVQVTRNIFFGIIYDLKLGLQAIGTAYSMLA